MAIDNFLSLTSELPKDVEGDLIQRSTEPPYDADTIPVMAVMVFQDKAFYKPLLKAVENFRKQTHQRKHLVLANTTEHTLVGADVEDISELRMGADEHLDVVIERALTHEVYSQDRHSELVTVLPIDTYSDPKRFAYQASYSYMGDARASMLCTQIRCAMEHNIAFLHSDPRGLRDTLMFSRVRGYGVNFDGTIRPTDMHGTLILPNFTFPYSCMHVSLHHGRSKTPLPEFLRWLVPAERYRGACLLGLKEAEYLKTVLEYYGMKAKIQAQVTARGHEEA